MGVRMNNLLNSIKTQILANISDIQSCFIYPPSRETIEAPAVFLEIANYAIGDQPSTEQLSLIANVEARVVVDSLDENAEIGAQILAQKIAKLAYLNNFGCNVKAGLVTGISRDFFKPDLDSYICWLVEWQHEFYVGDSVFEESGVPPHEIHINGGVI